MAKGKKTGGRKKGGRNKSGSLIGAEQDLRAAWEKCAGPKTAEKLVKDAVKKAFGYEVTEKTYGVVGNKRVLVKEKVKREFHYEPLGVILPYIAKKMPQAVEADGVKLPVLFTLATDNDAAPPER